MSSMRKMNKEMEIRKNGSVRVSTVNLEESRTQQQFKDEVNINKIVAKYKKSGVYDRIVANQGIYADLTQIPDFQMCQDKIAKAKQGFDLLPSEMRKRFHNDPAELIEFLQDDKNYEEAVKLGLVTQKPEASQPEQTTQQNVNNKNLKTKNTNQKNEPTGDASE